ncbi:hypothetical protein [Pannonibacter phragmitetus]|uniref:Uncharacterized protein n=1 Tax=Pannonibacter phragmitetus TaxID=121719 RepID=A0A0U3NFY0_9HYPH|nr:hypothetical protein APZ00_17150 [Pannonibacter phragmitetus]
MFPPIAALFKPKPGAGLGRQFPHGRACEALVGGAFQHSLDPCGVGPRLVPKRGEARDALAKGGFGRVERAGLDSIVEAL